MDVLEKSEGTCSRVLPTLNAPAQPAISSAHDEDVCVLGRFPNQFINLENRTTRTRAAIDENEASIVEFEGVSEHLHV